MRSVHRQASVVCKVQAAPANGVAVFGKLTKHIKEEIVMNRFYILRRQLAIVIMLIAAQWANASANLFRRISMEGVELVSGISWGQIDSYTEMDKGFYLLSYDNKYQPDTSNPLFTANPLGGCAYHDGKIYSNEFDTRNSNEHPMWRIYDASTHKLLSEHKLSDNCSSTTSGITYDATTNVLWGFNETYMEYYLVKIDPNTGEMTRIGMPHDRTYKYLGIACSPTGMLYCTYLDKETETLYLGKVRKTDGRITPIGTVTATNMLDGDTFINYGYDQSIFFNYGTGKLYWLTRTSSSNLGKEITALFQLNTATCQAEFVAYIPKLIHAPGCFFMEPDGKVPAIIETFGWKPDAEGAVGGTMMMDIPAKTYDGQQLSTPLTLHVVNDDGTELLSEQVQPSSSFVRHFDALAAGMHSVSIYVSNATGSSPKVNRTFLVGYDKPAAPTNIRLVADGLHTKLTWEPPTTGAHGQPIDAKNLKYKVVRYPYEVLVAEAQTELSFEEDHPADMTRYVYAVCAIDGTQQGESAFSNNLIVGTPLDVPYDGGGFATPFDVFNYYTVLDANADKRTWSYDQGSCRAYYMFNPLQPADDWFISPPINYKKGKTYRLTFSAYSSKDDYREDMDVTFGDGRTPELQSQMLMQLRDIPTETSDDAQDYYHVDFTVPEDGVYYYGFHAVSPAYHEILWLGEVQVAEAQETAISTMQTAAQAEVNVDRGVLEVKCHKPCHIDIYNAEGVVVAKTTAANLRLTLKSGLYVVRVAGKTFKAIVK